MPKSEEVMRVMIHRSVEDPETHKVTIERMNVYVDYDPRVKVGVAITLKDSEKPDEYWIINQVQEIAKRRDIKIGWNNNV